MFKWNANSLQLPLAWTLSIPAAYFVLGFLGNQFSTFVEVIALTVFVHAVAGLLAYQLVGRARNLLLSKPLDVLLASLLFMMLVAFVVSMLEMAKRFPKLFDAGWILLEKGQTASFLIGIAAVFPFLAWIVRSVKNGNLEKSRFYQLMSGMSTGMLVAGLFFAYYFIFASIFNQPVFDVDDIFFDSDGLLWRTRFTTDHYVDYYWRSVHPFVLLLIRPAVAFVSFIFGGDRLAATIFLTAFAGALCVFLAWYFVRHTVGNSIYAVMIATLLGASAAHLVFGTLIETYIFLAAVMMIFLVLLLGDSPLILTGVTGIVSFGITIANFIPTLITFIFIKRDYRQWIRYGLVVGALAIPLTLLNNYVYPNSQPYFFIPSSLGVEGGNTFVPSVDRAFAILRVMFFQSVVAPDPLILDEEIPFLKVWIFTAEPLRLSEYRTWLGTLLAFVWLVALLIGGGLFLKDLKKGNSRYSFAFLLVLAFNFVLHAQYGKDVFLYSTNWTYALVLFLALAWAELANNKWFQIGLIILLGLLLVNNSRLIYTMLLTSAQHIN